MYAFHKNFHFFSFNGACVLVSVIMSKNVRVCHISFGSLNRIYLVGKVHLVFKFSTEIVFFEESYHK